MYYCYSMIKWSSFISAQILVHKHRKNSEKEMRFRLIAYISSSGREYKQLNAQPFQKMCTLTVLQLYDTMALSYFGVILNIWFDTISHICNLKVE